MEHMTLQEIASACLGTYHGADVFLTRNVAGVAIDSRKIEQDYLFIPIKGERVDGHTFISQVMEAGALCTLTEQDLGNTPYPYILVDDCKLAMKRLAEHYRTALGIPVVGITGSVGKTSTKEMIASVLSQKYKVLKTEGNFNNEIGLPLTIFQIRKEHDIAILEMGISDFEEMHRLAKMAQPDVCVITNIGYCHLENLGDRDGVLRAKSEIFDYLKSNGAIVLNGDDDKLVTLREVKGIRPEFFGKDVQNDAYATNVSSHSLRGTSCQLHMGADTMEVMIPIPGEHMVGNALAGALVGRHFHLTPEEIKAGIEALVPVSGRNNLIETDSLLLIDDCYNANPVSMKASLDVLSLADTRKVAILGDMFELGVNEAELHRNVGIHAAEKKIDLVIAIGTLAREICDGVISTEKATTKACYFETKQEFLSQAKALLCKGDTVLIKASHGMEFPEIVESLKHW